MNDTLKNIVIDMLVKKLMALAVKEASYLTWGPLNYLTKLIITKVLTKAIEFGILELGSAMMQREVNNEVKNIRSIVEKYNADISETKRRELDNELRKKYDDIFKF